VEFFIEKGKDEIICELYFHHQQDTTATMNGLLVLIVAFVFLDVGLSERCRTNPQTRYLAWDVDYVAAESPSTSPDLTGFTEYVGLTLAQIEALTQEALQYYHTQFGVNLEGAIYLPGGIVVIPSTGVLSPLKFNAPWTLPASLPELPCATLKIAELPFAFTNPNFHYGGAYGAYAASLNRTLKVQPGDFVSYGYYVANFTDHNHEIFQKTFKIQTVFPTRVDTDGFTNEKTLLEDVTGDWGLASVFTSIIGYVLPNGSTPLKIRSDWRFPPGIPIIPGQPF
jgi:hypothetical protein